MISTILAVLVLVFDLLGIINVLAQPEKGLLYKGAWILAIIMFPILGLLGYLVFGT